MTTQQPTAQHPTPQYPTEQSTASRRPPRSAPPSSSPGAAAVPAGALHVVVGAAGATGSRVVAQLHAGGHRVRAVTRDGRPVGPAGVEPAAADAEDPRSLLRATRGADVVHLCAMPPLHRWRESFPRLVDAALEAAAASEARLVFADDTWMYGSVDAPMTEQTPWRPVSGKGVMRAWLAERLLHAAAGGGLRVSIVRAGELYGPGVTSMVAGGVFTAARRGLPVTWFGDPDLPITPTFIDDFAAGVAAVGVRDTGGAQVWHVPNPPATTGRALAAEACRQAGTRLRLVPLSTTTVRALGAVVPLAREGAELVYQFEQPYVVDGSRAAAAFGLTTTPYVDGVRAALTGDRTPLSRSHPAGATHRAGAAVAR